LAEDDYLKLVQLSMTFYESQMSGKLPAWNRVSASKGGWRRSAHLDDGNTIGTDLVGGFYDGGSESWFAAGWMQRCRPKALGLPVLASPSAAAHP
jgi:hypothetical protein